MTTVIAAVVLRRVLSLSAVCGRVRPHVRLKSGVVLARSFTDRTHAGLLTRPGLHVGAQRVGVSKEFPADGAHARISGAMHPRHVLR